jgi:hypothetical protein
MRNLALSSIVWLIKSVAMRLMNSQSVLAEFELREVRRRVGDGNIRPSSNYENFIFNHAGQGATSKYTGHDREDAEDSLP